MSDLPKRVHISEEGPREGFQFEKGAIPTARKIALIDALAQTGIDQIQIVSFVNPKAVPGMADAEDVVHGITPRSDVAYTALWLDIVNKRSNLASRLQQAVAQCVHFPFPDEVELVHRRSKLRNRKAEKWRGSAGAEMHTHHGRAAFSADYDVAPLNTRNPGATVSSETREIKRVVKFFGRRGKIDNQFDGAVG